MSALSVIAVASDLTPRSDRPFERAVMLARDAGAPLKLIHVLERQDRKSAERVRVTLDLLARSADMPVDIVLLAEGSAPRAIAEAAASLNADVLLVGPARFNSLTDFVLGTAVDYLLRHGSTPLLVVRDKPFNPYRHILVAVDFSAPSAAALNVAAALFPDCSIELVHCYTPAFPGRLEGDTGRAFALSRAEEEMAAFLARPDVAALRSRFQVKIVEGHPALVLSDLAAERANALIAIGAHGVGGFIHASLGSRASEILTSTPCDVLVVRRPDRM